MAVPERFHIIPTHIRRGPEATASARRIAAAHRQRQALELRKAGLTYVQIAERLGYRDHTGARYAVRTGLRATLQEPARDLRALQYERLESLLVTIWPRALAGDLAAVGKAVNVLRVESEPLGLNQPIRVDIEAEVRQMAETIGIDADEAVKEAQRIVKRLKL